MKRPLKVPTKTISQADFLELQAKYDRKLAKMRDDDYPDGFRDIECGMDYNLMATSTFPLRDHGANGPQVYVGLDRRSLLNGRMDNNQRSLNRESDVLESVFEAPRARAWSLFSQGAHELPTDRRTRGILVAVAETGSVREAARRRRVPKSVVHRLATRLCEAVGVEPRNLFGSLVEQDDDPARIPRKHRECAGCRAQHKRGIPGPCPAHRVAEPDVAAAG